MAGESIQTRTGTRDETYNLISVLYHQLQAAETCEQYARDAREAHDEELVDFFEECIERSRQICERAKELLTERLDQVFESRAHDERVADEASRESFPASDSPAY